MADNTGGSSPTGGLGDLMSMFAGSNPLSGISKSVAQFQRGTNDFMAAVENFNATMEQVTTIAARVNRLLDDVEPAIRTLMPQVTRTLKATDSLVEQMSAVPSNLTEFMTVLGDVARRLQPLGQLAESAGGLFGLRQLTSLLPPGPGRSAAPPAPPAPTAASRAPGNQAAPKKAAAKKAAAKKAAAKKQGTKKQAAKKAAATPSTGRSRR